MPNIFRTDRGTAEPDSSRVGFRGSKTGRAFGEWSPEAAGRGLSGKRPSKNPETQPLTRSQQWNGKDCFTS